MRESDVLVCRFCPSTFTRPVLHERHLNCHTHELPFKCTFCIASFPLQSALDTHAKAHNSKKPFQCVYCPNTFQTKSALTSHQNSHDKTKFVHCQHCELPFETGEELDEHERLHEIRTHRCTSCDASFSDRASLRTHQRTHDGASTLFFCEECTQTFQSKLEMDAHLLLHRFKCKCCDSAFANEVRYQKHIQKHKCLYCDFQYQSAAARDAHHCQKEAEAKKRIADARKSGAKTCPDCKKTFEKGAHECSHVAPCCEVICSSKSDLEVHRCVFICKFCTKEFTSLDSKETHERKQACQFKCQHCKAAFSTRATSLEHKCPRQCQTCLEFYLEGQAPKSHKCSFIVACCGASLGSMAEKEAHQCPLLTCMLCKGVFSSITSKESHEQKKACQRNKCMYCESVFPNPTRLRTHECTRFCSECSEYFALDVDMSKHACTPVCEHCRTQFSSPVAFRTHDCPRHCRACDAKFASKATRDKHICPRACTECSALIPLTEDIADHRCKWKAPCCSLEFSTKQELAKHSCRSPARKRGSSSGLEGSKKDAANVKEEAPADAAAPKEGVSKTETPAAPVTPKVVVPRAPPLMCQYCGEIFPRLDDKRRHEVVHLTEANPFHCRFCDAAFRSKYFLKLHHTTDHEKEYQESQLALIRAHQENSNDLDHDSAYPDQDDDAFKPSEFYRSSSDLLAPLTVADFVYQAPVNLLASAVVAAPQFDSLTAVQVSVPVPMPPRQTSISSEPAVFPPPKANSGASRSRAKDTSAPVKRKADQIERDMAYAFSGSFEDFCKLIDEKAAS
eukprot:m.275896 g.275896  ORF g.275896 m.275896 type:complete len:792 (-) comp54855_c0_seq2:1088-3463(-)